MAEGNVLLDFEVERAVDITAGADQLVKNYQRLLIGAENYLKNVRDAVAKYGKPELVAVLGGPVVTEMQALYNRTKAFIEATSTLVVVPDME